MFPSDPAYLTNAERDARDAFIKRRKMVTNGFSVTFAIFVTFFLLRNPDLQRINPSLAYILLAAIALVGLVGYTTAMNSIRRMRDDDMKIQIEAVVRRNFLEKMTHSKYGNGSRLVFAYDGKDHAFRPYDFITREYYNSLFSSLKDGDRVFLTKAEKSKIIYSVQKDYRRA